MSKLISALVVVFASVFLFASPGFAHASSSYTWEIDCSGAAANGSAGTGVSWTWLHDGVQISLTSPPNGFAACVGTPLSGSGEIPASINGIEVNGITVTLSLSESPAGCDASASVTKSFSPLDPKISINESVSAPNNNGKLYGSVKCPAASFSFRLSTP